MTTSVVSSSQSLDLQGRTLLLRNDTFDEDARTVEAVVATESPVPAVDWDEMRMVDEVLPASAGSVAGKLVPLLDAHDRTTAESVLGSAREFRVEDSKWASRLHFARDERSQRTMEKVRDGHITDVSIGYRITDEVMIEPGETAVVNGREFNASTDRPLRVAKSWRIHEVSVAPIGADEQAKFRALLTKEKNMPTQPHDTAITQPDNSDKDNVVVAPAETEDRSIDAFSVATDVIKAERERVSAIRALASSNTSTELLDKAIDDGVSVDVAARWFLEDERNKRVPAIHSKGSEERNQLGVLEAAMLMRSGLDPIKDHVRVSHGNVRKGIGNQETLERNADLAHSMRDMSLMDLARHALMLDGVDPGKGRGELLEALRTRAYTGPSTATVTNLFTTNFSAQLIAGYGAAADTTPAFTVEADVPDFKTTDRVRLQHGNAMTKHPRGGEATHTSREDTIESYKVHRYSSQFVIDEMDLIDDRFGGLQTTPQDLGVAAAQVRPDLVYSVIAANANMRDGSALFVAGHGNLNTSAALAQATLQEAVKDLNVMQENGRNLPATTSGYIVLVPWGLFFTASQLVESATVDSAVGNFNPLRAVGFTVVSDARLDNGVTDPSSGTTYAGSGTTWYLARPGDRYTIEVGYLQGSGRAPQVRSFMLDRGQWGIGWDIVLDIGAKALDWRGMIKNTA